MSQSSHLLTLKDRIYALGSNDVILYATIIDTDNAIHGCVKQHRWTNQVLDLIKIDTVLSHL